MQSASKKILVVEDEKEILDLIQMYLEREGYRTVTAMGGGRLRDETVPTEGAHRTHQGPATPCRTNPGRPASADVWLTGYGRHKT